MLWPGGMATDAPGEGERIAAVAGEKYSAALTPSAVVNVTCAPTASGTLLTLGTHRPMLSSFRITVVVLITHNLSFFVLAVQQMFLLRGKQSLLEAWVLAQCGQLRLILELDRM